MLQISSSLRLLRGIRRFLFTDGLRNDFSWTTTTSMITFLAFNGESHAFLFFWSLNHVVGWKVRIDTCGWLYYIEFLASRVHVPLWLIPSSILSVQGYQISRARKHLATGKSRYFFVLKEYVLMKGLPENISIKYFIWNQLLFVQFHIICIGFYPLFQ